MTRQREKLLNAIIFFANNTNYCHKLKIMKLLYYLDFWHFKETGRAVTGLKYEAWEMGPVPKSLFREIEPEKNTGDFKEFIEVEREILEYDERYCLHFKPVKDFNSKIFSRRELQILERVATDFKDAKSEDMKDSTHLHNSPWSHTPKNQEIDYMLALDDEEDSLSREEVLHRQQIESEMSELLDD